MIGCNSAIGLAITEALAAAGADIIAVQIDEEQSAVSVAKKYGRKCTVFVCNQSSKTETAELIPRILKAGHKPNIFVSWSARKHSMFH